MKSSSEDKKGDGGRGRSDSRGRSSADSRQRSLEGQGRYDHIIGSHSPGMSHRPPSAHSPAMNHAPPVADFVQSRFPMPGGPFPGYGFPGCYDLSVPSPYMMPFIPPALLDPRLQQTLLQHQIQQNSVAAAAVAALGLFQQQSNVAAAMSYQSTSDGRRRQSDAPTYLPQKSSSPSLRINKKQRDSSGRDPHDSLFSSFEPTDLRTGDRHHSASSSRSFTPENSDIQRVMDLPQVRGDDDDHGNRVSNVTPYKSRAKQEITVHPQTVSTEEADVDIDGCSEADDSSMNTRDLFRRNAASITSGAEQYCAKLESVKISAGFEGGSDRENSRTPSMSDGAVAAKINAGDDTVDALSDGRQSTDGSCLSGLDTDTVIGTGSAPARPSIILPPRKRILRNPEELVVTTSTSSQSIVPEEVSCPTAIAQHQDEFIAKTDLPLPTVAMTTESPLVVVETAENSAPQSPIPGQSDSPSSTPNFRSVWKKFAAKSTPTVVGGPAASGLPGVYRGFNSGGKPLYYQKTMAGKDSLSGKPFFMPGGKPRGFFYRGPVSRTSPHYGPGKPEVSGAVIQDGSSSPRVTRSQSRQRKKKDSPKQSPSSEPPPVRKSMRKKVANSKYEMGVAGHKSGKGKKKEKDSSPSGIESGAPEAIASPSNADDVEKIARPVETVQIVVSLERVDEAALKNSGKDAAKKKSKTEQDEDFVTETDSVKSTSSNTSATAIPPDCAGRDKNEEDSATNAVDTIVLDVGQLLDVDGNVKSSSTPKQTEQSADVSTASDAAHVNRSLPPKFRRQIRTTFQPPPSSTDDAPPSETKSDAIPPSTILPSATGQVPSLKIELCRIQPSKHSPPTIATGHSSTPSNQDNSTDNTEATKIDSTLPVTVQEATGEGKSVELTMNDSELNLIASTDDSAVRKTSAKVESSSKVESVESDSADENEADMPKLNIMTIKPGIVEVTSAKTDVDPKVVKEPAILVDREIPVVVADQKSTVIVLKMSTHSSKSGAAAGLRTVQQPSVITSEIKQQETSKARLVMTAADVQSLSSTACSYSSTKRAPVTANFKDKSESVPTKALNSDSSVLLEVAVTDSVTVVGETSTELFPKKRLTDLKNDKIEDDAVLNAVSADSVSETEAKNLRNVPVVENIPFLADDEAPNSILDTSKSKTRGKKRNTNTATPNVLPPVDKDMGIFERLGTPIGSVTPEVPTVTVQKLSISQNTKTDDAIRRMNTTSRLAKIQNELPVSNEPLNKLAAEPVPVKATAKKKVIYEMDDNEKIQTPGNKRRRKDSDTSSGSKIDRTPKTDVISEKQKKLIAYELQQHLAILEQSKSKSSSSSRHHGSSAAYNADLNQSAAAARKPRKRKEKVAKEFDKFTTGEPPVLERSGAEGVEPFAAPVISAPGDDGPPKLEMLSGNAGISLSQNIPPAGINEASTGRVDKPKIGISLNTTQLANSHNQSDSVADLSMLTFSGNEPDILRAGSSVSPTSHSALTLDEKQAADDQLQGRSLSIVIMKLSHATTAVSERSGLMESNSEEIVPSKIGTTAESVVEPIKLSTSLAVGGWKMGAESESQAATSKNKVEARKRKKVSDAFASDLSSYTTIGDNILHIELPAGQKESKKRKRRTKGQAIAEEPSEQAESFYTSMKSEFQTTDANIPPKRKPIYCSPPSASAQPETSSTGQMKCRFVKVGRRWITFSEQPTGDTDESSECTAYRAPQVKNSNGVLVSSPEQKKKPRKKRSKTITDDTENMAQPTHRKHSGRSTDSAVCLADKRPRDLLNPLAATFTIADLHKGLLRLGWRTLLIDMDERSEVNDKLYLSSQHQLSQFNAEDDEPLIDDIEVVCPESTFYVPTEIEILMKDLTLSNVQRSRKQSANEKSSSLKTSGNVATTPSSNASATSADHRPTSVLPSVTKISNVPRDLHVMHQDGQFDKLLTDIAVNQSLLTDSATVIDLLSPTDGEVESNEPVVDWLAYDSADYELYPNDTLVMFDDSCDLFSPGPVTNDSPMFVESFVHGNAARIH